MLHINIWFVAARDMSTQVFRPSSCPFHAYNLANRGGRREGEQQNREFYIISVIKSIARESF
jgi:hypothetical protein